MVSFRRKRTLEELHEEDERLEAEASVAQRKAVIKEYERRSGNSWQMLGSQGKLSNDTVRRAWNWLKTN